jgi:hypothetical protein
MSVTYHEGQQIFLYKHHYESVSWRHVVDDVLAVANNYLVGEVPQSPNVAFVLANGIMQKYGDTGTCYQIWVTGFEFGHYWVGYTLHPEFVPHYSSVNTQYRMHYKVKQWEVTGAPNESVPAFDHIPTTTEVADMFFQGLERAGISVATGGGSPFPGTTTSDGGRGGALHVGHKILQPSRCPLSAKEILQEYIGNIRLTLEDASSSINLANV